MAEGQVKHAGRGGHLSSATTSSKSQRSFLVTMSNVISCPECHSPAQVPGRDVNNIPTAFRINQLIKAFQQAQVLVETADSPNVAEMCQVHPAQPLAIYCETCNKQLCRDCVLTSKEHNNHEYDIF